MGQNAPSACKAEQFTMNRFPLIIHSAKALNDAQVF